MRIVVCSVILISFIAQSAKAQVGINTEQPKATLDVVVKDPDNPETSAGVLVPRVSKNPESGNEKGQLIFNTTSNQFYFWDGTKWAPIASNAEIATAGTSYFADTKNSTPISLDQNSSETLVPQTAIEFSLAKEQEVQFTSTVNFKGRSSAFAPLFKLKLTKTDASTEEIIDKVSNTFLSDGISDYYGNLQLLSIKKLPAGSYKAEIVAYYNNCCDFNFIYEVGGAETPVSLLIQYK
ncbi:hypothetical protein EQP59_02490 [Ornithobacterium rhinotracheale]|uniref:Uncharacterized protein n=1 Tax=Ornithobacterium rhinotracheale TaxID=28251 RepID=A0A3R5UR54_ORNRH|nr:hypothetical protein [Ornithobacterium rhinotracheale]QAR30307.1 hypothetical protein EQP59_02490 [Ornithobacterium rhinotracheale]